MKQKSNFGRWDICFFYFAWESENEFVIKWIIIVDIDLEKFFDTVNHDKLMTLIGRTIKDGDVISIVRKYLVSGIMIDDEYEDSVIGTPQGGLC